MAKYTKVRFLKYFNRPPVFVAIEIDTIGIFFLISFSIYISLSLTSIISPYFSFLTGFGLGFVGAYYYTKYKTEAPKGYLKHLFYTLHLYRVKPKGFKEVDEMDVEVDDYYPNPNEKLFME